MLAGEVVGIEQVSLEPATGEIVRARLMRVAGEDASPESVLRCAGRERMVHLRFGSDRRSAGPWLRRAMLARRGADWRQVAASISSRDRTAGRLSAASSWVTIVSNWRPLPTVFDHATRVDHGIAALGRPKPRPRRRSGQAQHGGDRRGAGGRWRHRRRRGRGEHPVGLNASQFPDEPQGVSGPLVEPQAAKAATPYRQTVSRYFRSSLAHHDPPLRK